ncbi:MAG: MFS transporter [Verrucomicrobiota bacterium JB022]|nr:MFS transporter [Verrucomicrobiota bacterium JB022]
MPRASLWHLSLHQGLLSLQAQAAWLLVPLWGAQIGWGLQETGLVLAAQATGTAVGSVLAGLCAARWGAARMVRWSSWLVAAFSLALLVPQAGLFYWAALRALAGVATGLSRGLVPMVAVRGEDSPRRSLSLSTAGYVAGQAAGLPLALVVGAAISPAFVLGGLGGLLLVSTAVLRLAKDAPPAAVQKIRALWQALGQEVRTPATLGTASLYAVSFAIGGALLAYLPVWWTEEKVRSSGQLAVWLCIAGVVQAGVLILLSQLQVQRSVVRRIGGWMCASGLVCLTGPLWWQLSPMSAGVWVLLMLVTRAGRIPAIQESLFARGSDASQAVRLSLCYGVAELGRAMGASAAGWIYPQGGFAGVALASGLLAALALLALPWLSHSQEVGWQNKGTPASE